MTTVSLKQRLIRFKDLMPCKAAFIDAKTPESGLLQEPIAVFQLLRDLVR
jgi:hypothetical protein